MNEALAANVIVEMVRDARARHGRDRFSCSLDEWHAVLSLAEEFGWHPQGVTYEVPAGSKMGAPALRDYEPGDASDRKLLDAADAIALGHALTRARDSPRLASLLAGTAEGPMRTLINELAQYAYGGSFLFARSDAAQVVP